MDDAINIIKTNCKIGIIFVTPVMRAVDLATGVKLEEAHMIIRDKLKRYGVKGETYEDVIVKLMKDYDSNAD